MNLDGSIDYNETHNVCIIGSELSLVQVDLEVFLFQLTEYFA